MRLPWLAGLAALLAVAALAAGFSRRDAVEGGVVSAVVDADRALAGAVAQSVRRSLNEASDDLAQVADAVGPQVREGQVPLDLAQTLLAATDAQHERYRLVGVVRAGDGTWVTTVGSGTALPLGPRRDDVRDVRVLDDGRLVLTVPLGHDGGLVVAGVYDVRFLVPALDPAPAVFALVDDRGRRLDLSGAAGAAVPDPSAEARRALDRATADRPAVEVTAAAGSARTTSAALVAGAGPAGRADLSVVLARDVAAGGVQSRGQERMLLAAALLLLVSAAVFALLHLAVLRPLTALQRQAERVAYGDLSQPLTVDAYDEIGRTVRAFERLRLALIRARVQDLDVRTEQRSGEGR